jgi:ribosomal peptide maturation radical SAM protein 1
MPEKVLLVSMPFGELTVPGLGLCLLKPALARRGIECDIRYFGLDLFAHYFPVSDIGTRFYQYLLTPSSLFFFGEWIFAATLFQDIGPPPIPKVSFDSGSKYHDLRSEVGAAIDFALNLRGSIPGFLADCIRSIPWRDYAVVGFSSCFNQNLGSVALALEIKKHHPQVITVVGGANADGPMGSALLKSFPQIDYVFRGEADVTFPIFVQSVLEGQPLPDLPGVTGRLPHRGQSAVSPIVGDLDDLPYPDFDDFYRQADALRLLDLFGIEIPVEASRGCWWGERHHCTFCGLNREGMTFRRKSPERLLEEIEYLGRRYGASRYAFTDNILDFGYLKDLFPEIIRRRWDLDLFFEVKANITASKMAILRQAGVRRIQPGIESLSTHVLSLMRKGTSQIQNIECLRNCRACDVTAIWSHLYGFPGETLKDYEKILEVIPSLHHLEPPGGLNPAIVQRFAPFFDTPESFGIRNVRPNSAYRAIYPFEDEIVRDLAYFFDDDRDVDPRVREFVLGPLSTAIGEWRASYRRGAILECVKVGGRAVVLDTRAPKAVAWLLEVFDSAVLSSFDHPTSVAAALRKFGSTVGIDLANGNGFLTELFGPIISGESDESMIASYLVELGRKGFHVERLGSGSPELPLEERFRSSVKELLARQLLFHEAETLLALPIIAVSANVGVGPTSPPWSGPRDGEVRTQGFPSLRITK